MPAFDERRYQVFISSTFADLELERQKVLQSILEMKAFPAGMELFPSADDEQWSFIQREIESSDYYLVIVAGKYGSIAADGRSFTEKEYDYAVSLNKYTMGFLARNLLDLKGSQLEQDPARREKLELFRAKVSSNRLVKFYDNPADLKALVMQSLMHAFQMRPQEGWARAKNARRMEDLEEITTLQKRLIELEAENAKLRKQVTDPTLAFAQGDDTAEWTLRLIESGGMDAVAPPAVLFRFRTTWNELLATCFTEAPSVTSSTAKQQVARLLLSSLSRSFPDAGGWLSRQRVPGLDVDADDFRKIIASAERQFLGLGLMDIVSVQESTQYGVTTPQGIQPHMGFRNVEHWRLTEKGNLQFLAVRGVRRKQAAAE
jgi:hypothetical protein